ncbi:hypothetical protein THASP1DRAFT_28540 [Thamnocephalis sphaerospora]|uniref:DUF221-domain-containing protein n=1 Tax=Thamnocephalis sphaerospora TaxID=78915 RepID=A0A4P9XTX7_9FUNG|nr:hypothetical protein THASP1DRAFT_28540 [Thamnocephalis sphaerospora]|eukprot:RKP09655.1 hypothetical protein THASP1DRAFT_28540 [Thamnocephalis sphaerospora]
MHVSAAGTTQRAVDARSSRISLAHLRPSWQRWLLPLLLVAAIALRASAVPYTTRSHLLWDEDQTDEPSRASGRIGAYSADPDKELRQESMAYVLLTQLLATCTLGTLGFLLFCWLRTRWPEVYAPKEVARVLTPQSFMPKSFFGWIPGVLRLRESQVMATLGPDALTYLRLWDLGMRLFAALTFWALLLLVPINVFASHGDVSNKVPLSMDIVPPSSPYLLVHLIFIYLFTLLTCYYLHREYRSFVSLRRFFLTRSNPGVHAKTVLVSGLPRDLRADGGDSLRNFFEGLGVGKVHQAWVVPQVDQLQIALHKRANTLRALERSFTIWDKNRRRTERQNQALRRQMSAGEAAALIRTASSSSRPTIHVHNGHHSMVGWCEQATALMCGNADSLNEEMTDAIDHYTAKFVERDDAVRRLRRGPFTYSGTGFVTFKTQSSANIAAQTANCSEPFTCITRMAPEYRDIFWPNLSIEPQVKSMRIVALRVVVIAVVIFWAFPIAAVASLGNLSDLAATYPRFRPIVKWSPLLTRLAEGLLPTAAVSLMVALLKATFERFSVLQGHRTYSAIELSTLTKYFSFQLINVVLVHMITNTIIQTLLKIIAKPESIFEHLGSAFPKAAPFFINYMMLQSFVVLPVAELLQLSMIATRILGLFRARTPRERAALDRPPAPNYGWLYPLPLLLFVVALTFSVTVPLILPVAAVFFFAGKLIYSYQFVRVYQPRYESGGRAWPYIFRRLIVGLLLFQLSTSGLLTLKECRIYALLVLPALAGTLLFASYCVQVYESNSYYLPLDVASGLAREEEDVLLATGETPDGAGADKAESADEFGDRDDGEPDAGLYSPPASGAFPSPDLGASQRASIGSGSFWSKKLKRAASASIASTSSIGNSVAQVFNGRRSDPQNQAPMTRIDGVLDSDLKSYEHLAIKGELPQPWPPQGLHATRRRGVRSYFSL